VHQALVTKGTEMELKRYGIQEYGLTGSSKFVEIRATMGYSLCFLVKNGQKCIFFSLHKKNKLKGVKMTQKRSKAWTIVHAFWSKMHVFA
jgi:hypothetical protein